MDTLQESLPLVVQTRLRQAVTPLAQDGKLPAAQDLTPWFEAAEQGIAGIGPKISADKLGVRQIRVLAPLVAGREVWDAVKHLDPQNWAQFKV